MVGTGVKTVDGDKVKGLMLGAMVLPAPTPEEPATLGAMVVEGAAMMVGAGTVEGMAPIPPGTPDAMVLLAVAFIIIIMEGAMVGGVIVEVDGISCKSRSCSSFLVEESEAPRSS